MKNRRDFIKTTAGAAGVASLGLAACVRKDQPVTEQAITEKVAAKTTGSLNLLILGGTGFIGPHMVERALARGHKVTLFNRGKTNADLFPDVETLVGDRDGKLDALAGKRFDAVIDNSGYVPRHVRDSAALLNETVGRYLFISSISAYADFETKGIDEDYAVATMPDETVEQITGETYGPMKALCEKAVSDVFGERATIIRPGYIVGPRDRTDRWTYWPLRVERGGEMLVPGEASDPVQFIDARDLARFTVAALEDDIAGTFNAVGPAETLTMESMLQSMRASTDSDVTLHWVDAARIEEQNVQFPIWASAVGEFGGAHQVSNARAVANGMSFRPLEETTTDTLAWWHSQDAARKAAMRSGLRVTAGPEQRPGPLSMTEQMSLESELLEAFKA